MSELDLSVVIPAYNEEERLRRFVPGIVEYLQGKDSRFEIVVANDGSADSTARVTEELTKLHPMVRLISLNPNQGKGGAVKAGMLEARGRSWATSTGGRCAVFGAALLVLAVGLCFFDGDGHHHDDGTAQDLCLGMIVASLMVVPLTRPLASYRVLPEPHWPVRAGSPHLPDPPPKLVSSF